MKISEYRNSSPISHTVSARDILRRPEVKLVDLLPLTGEAWDDEDVRAGVEFEIKYEGYVKRMIDEVERYRKQENRRIPKSFDYNSIKSLSHEAREKLSAIRPENLGQAARISGVKPGDVTVLMIYLEKGAKKK